MTLSTPEELAAALQRVANTPRLLIASDFDGTLAPLANEPLAARMLPAAQVAVDALTRLPGVTVAFVSGRSLVDLKLISEHTDDSSILLAGSHGAEFWFPGVGDVEPDEDPADMALRDRLREHAVAATSDLPRVFIEPKTFGFGVHTRTADAATAELANERVDAIVAAEAPQWRRRTGHNIVEYAFRHEGKDSAVAALRERVDATCVLFAGDDITDEDALSSLGPEDLGVHIGASPTAATLSVADIPAFAEFLSELARLRAAAFAAAPSAPDPAFGGTTQE
jgi:trehalose 6-phosphate phosphatase